MNTNAQTFATWEPFSFPVIAPAPIEEKAMLEKRIADLEQEKTRLQEICNRGYAENREILRMLGLGRYDAESDKEEIEVIGQIIEGVRFLIRQHAPASRDDF